jgi:NAD(P)-dependent dehydrogenase (short-subunit alcohol dehydrogenase family)
MAYFVTGGSGFIGKRLIRALLERPNARVYVLLRNPSADRLAELFRIWGADATRVIPIKGDVTQHCLGIESKHLEQIAGKVDHFFHLAAIYDLEADPEAEMRTNIDGTRNAVALAAAIGSKCFHHMSSIAAAGLYQGVFREDMFEEATNLDHPYFASKHESEKLVRNECRIPWRIYRPGLVIGDSRTGEMDKVDGPYYFFKLIQKMRKLLPSWMPSIAIEGGRINLVPVDFVVAALVHLAHIEGEDGRCFHLTDPHPHRVAEILSIFAHAAHAPDMTIRLNAALLRFIPPGIVATVMALTPTRRIRKAVMKDLGLPEDIFTFVNYPTRFDNREAARLLEPAGIRVPPLEEYAWRIWDYWERHLDPDLRIDQSLTGRAAGRIVLVTGGSAGIGKATALRLAAAGATTLIVARDAAKLEKAREEAAARGLTLFTYSADIADPTQCDAVIQKITAEYGHVDILVNNAGRSIRRAIENSFTRLHDFERTMQLNYFACLRVTMGFLPEMVRRRNGHVVNISSIGVLTNAPRFSAYIASKAALEAWTRCAASEFLDRGVEFTTINMPLVRTAMSAPTKFYDNIPRLTPEEAAELVVEAIARRPVRIATKLGIFGQILHAVMPHVAQIIMNTAFHMFPDSAAAAGKPIADEIPNADQVAFTQLLRGIHL